LADRTYPEDFPVGYFVQHMVAFEGRDEAEPETAASGDGVASTG
jgi:hypothetical protein